MSILRRAAGVEDRATGVTISGPSPSYPNPPIPDGYGMPGAGKWQQGMVWQSAPSFAFGAVSTDQAMRLSAVFACLRLLTDAVATLPLGLFTRQQGARVPYYPRPVYLSFELPQQAKTAYLSQVMLSLLTDGNLFVLTPRDDLGVPIDLVVLDPCKVNITVEKGRVRYRVDGIDEPMSPLEVMHVPGLLLPGQLRGISPLSAAREVIEGGRSQQDYGRNFIRNHAMPPGVIEMGATGNTEADMERARMLGDAWNQARGGVDQAGKVGVLAGATLKTIAVNPADAQWLETKQFTVQDVARFYGVPPHLIADASNSTSWGSGLAEQNLAFGQFSVAPWIERIEEGHTRLLSTHGLPNVFIKLNLDARLRGATKDRYDAYAVALDKGFLTVDEVRSLEDLPPLARVNDSSMSSRQLAEALQKIYLAVGNVISADEAREILNREGAGLTGPAPSTGGGQ